MMFPTCMVIMCSVMLDINTTLVEYRSAPPPQQIVVSKETRDVHPVLVQCNIVLPMGECRVC